MNYSTSANGILGITQRKNEVLHFAKDNNFKRLDLTHLDEIFPSHLTDPTPSGNSYQNDLCSFMTEAREDYCIEQIAAVASAFDFFDDVNSWNTLHFTSPYNFSTSSIPGINTFGSSFSYVQNTYTSSDGSIALKSEMMKYFLRLLDYNYRSSTSDIVGSLHPCRFDVFTIEFEYWNPPFDWPTFRQLMLDLNTLQFNTSHAFDIHLYTLIRDFTDITGSSITKQQIADFIDPLVDKIYLTDYPNTDQFGTSNVPDDFWNLNYFRWGMDALRNNSTPHTIITPLFNCLLNNEGIHDWLVDPAHPEHTLFTAEQLFWTLKAQSGNSALIGDNILTEGSYQWIYYTYFPMITSHWSYTYCTNNEIFYVPNQPIACPATNTISACTGNNILFKYISNYEASVSCKWDFGDGTILPSVSPGDQTHVYNQPGTYIVKCELTFPPSHYLNSQAACEYATFQRTVIVSGAGISANGSTTFCQGNSIQLTSTSGSSYSWITPSGIHFSTQGITANENGTYKVTVTNSNVCVSSTASIAITVNPLPVVSVGPVNPLICSGFLVGLNASGVGNFSWSPPQGLNCINCANVIASPSATTSYVVTLTDANGCTASSSSTVTVSNPSVSITPGGIKCIGTQLCANTGFVSYNWLPNHETTSCIPTSSSSINYSVTITDANGCTASTSSSLTQSCCGQGTSLDQAYFNSVSIIPSGLYNLNSNIILTRNITLDGCNIQVGRGYSITVPNSFILTVQNGAKLSACGDMWRGIIVNGSGKLAINPPIIPLPSSCIIQDAQYAVEVKDNAIININKCDFINDYIGVNMYDLSVTGPIHINGYIKP